MFVLFFLPSKLFYIFNSNFQTWSFHPVYALSFVTILPIHFRGLDVFGCLTTASCHAVNLGILGLCSSVFTFSFDPLRSPLKKNGPSQNKRLSFPYHIWGLQVRFSPKLTSRYMKNEAHKCIFTTNQSTYKLHQTSAISWTLDIWKKCVIQWKHGLTHNHGLMIWTISRTMLVNTE